VVLARGGLLAHRGVSGPAPFIAVALLLAGLGAFIGAGWLFTHRPNALARTGAIGLGAVGVGCLALGTILPLFLGARPSLGRPSTTARLEIVSPTPGQVFHGGDPAPIHVELRVDGGQVVPFTSLRLVPNEGHIHLYLDGSLVSMTAGLEADLAARTGQHELEAEFVAVDHAPFDPPVRASVTFEVSA
jgi:hypothetical protein